MEQQVEQVSSASVGFEPCVRDLMSKEVFTLNSSDNLNLLEEFMKWKRIRHVPVVNEDNELVGLVTHRDFLRVAISQLAETDVEDIKSVYKEIPVSKIMNRNIFVVKPDCSLAEAASVMRKNKYGCLPVVNNNSKLVGIITEADFLKAFEEWDTVFTR